MLHKFKLLLLVLFCFLSFIIQAKEKPIIKKGVLDLKEWNFQKDGLIRLSGEWEFYWNQLYKYNDFQIETPPNSEVVEIPSSWTKYQIKDKFLPP